MKHSVAFFSTFLFGLLAQPGVHLAILLPIAALTYYVIITDQPMRTPQEIAQLTSERINLIADIIAGKEDIIDVIDCYPDMVAEKVFTYGMTIDTEKDGLIEVSDASTLDEDPKIAAERLYQKIKDDGIKV